MAGRLPNFEPSHRGAAASIAEELQHRARAIEADGTEVLYLQVGQPSTGAPAGCLEAVQQASLHTTLGYTGSSGIPELRERISRQYRELYATEVDPDRIVITFGASGAMILTLIGCFDAGKRIGLPQPFYYGYRYAMATLGLECVPFETSMENGFQPTVALFDGACVPCSVRNIPACGP